jgi:hypothetical protein
LVVKSLCGSQKHKVRKNPLRTCQLFLGRGAKGLQVRKVGKTIRNKLWMSIFHLRFVIKKLKMLEVLPRRIFKTEFVLVPAW